MKYAEYIKTVEIDALWGKRKHILWHLDRHVNILSGINGIGKSTILQKTLKQSEGVHLTLVPEDATDLRYDVIEKYTIDPDTQLAKLEKDFMAYKNGQSSASGSQGPSASVQRFYDLIDQLYGQTDKTIIRDADGIRFMQEGDILTTRQLSSGEKQMMLILLTVLLEDRQPYVLFMDEPEVSLHVDWQQQLVTIITELNPEIQLILTTHSPAVVMNGWLDKVTEVSEITVK
jgi:predicted ATP-binding protein involved in virulence